MLCLDAALIPILIVDSAGMQSPAESIMVYAILPKGKPCCIAIYELSFTRLDRPYAGKACDAISVISEKLMLNTSIALPQGSAT